jgi:hypothetical protein
MRLLKIAAVSYIVKTLLIGAAWLAIPDLPQRARAAFQQTWMWMHSTSGAGETPRRAPVDAVIEAAPRPADRAEGPTTR